MRLSNRPLLPRIRHLEPLIRVFNRDIPFKHIENHRSAGFMLQVPTSGRIPVYFTYIVIKIFDKRERNIGDTELRSKRFQDVKGRHIDPDRFGIQALFSFSF